VTQAQTPLLALESLQLRIAGRVLVDALTLTVGHGDIWAVLGRNGAGKSTLLGTLAGLCAPDGGEVRLRGRRLGDWRRGEAARIRAYLPQAVHDAFSLGVLDSVLLGRHPHIGRWQWEGDEDRRMALAALATVDMAECGARDVLSLSGGERQRVALAQVLAQDPDLLLLDEPTAHLDMHHQVSVMHALSGLARERGKAIVVATHDLNLAARFATHVLILRGDGATRHGPTHEVMTEQALSETFSHPLQRIETADSTLFVPRW